MVLIWLHSVLYVCGLQVFYLVPVIGICFNIFPVNNSFWFALAFTLYIVMIQVRRLS
jgi:hypothetical protein